MHPSTSVQTPALRSVANIATGDDLQTQVVIQSGALPALLSLLSSPKEGIRGEVCWTISNITAGSPPQIQAVINANIIPPLINILSDTDLATRKEACWAISNATKHGLQEPAQIRYLVDQGCIKPLCDLLMMMDSRIIRVALGGLNNILEVGEMDRAATGLGAANLYATHVEEAGGMITIHNLQSHYIGDICKKAYNIMDKFFPDDKEVDAGTGPANVDASGAFAVSPCKSLLVAFEVSDSFFSFSSARTLKLIPLVVADTPYSRNRLFLCHVFFPFFSLHRIHPMTPTRCVASRNWMSHWFFPRSSVVFLFIPPVCWPLQSPITYHISSPLLSRPV